MNDVKLGYTIGRDKVLILENGREYFTASDGSVYTLGRSVDLLPVVAKGGLVYKFDLDQLISYAIDQLENK